MCTGYIKLHFMHILYGIVPLVYAFEYNVFKNKNKKIKQKLIITNNCTFGIFFAFLDFLTMYVD